MTEPGSGRWIRTFACDIEPGDKIRISRDGDERIVASRNYPPVTQPTFRLEFGIGSEDIGKLAHVEIWDPDGSVGQRVQNISARAIW
jgi:hypothetical protein